VFLPAGRRAHPHLHEPWREACKLAGIERNPARLLPDGGQESRASRRAEDDGDGDGRAQDGVESIAATASSTRRCWKWGPRSLKRCNRLRGGAGPYPAEAFAGQVLAILDDGPDKLKGWRGTFIPARIAELVAALRHIVTRLWRCLSPRSLLTGSRHAGRYGRDRRSAALQLGEAFREVRFASIVIEACWELLDENSSGVCKNDMLQSTAIA